jgi:hypothetical protein
MYRKISILLESHRRKDAIAFIRVENKPKKIASAIDRGTQKFTSLDMK